MNDFDIEELHKQIWSAKEPNHCELQLVQSVLSSQVLLDRLFQARVQLWRVESADCATQLDNQVGDEFARGLFGSSSKSDEFSFEFHAHFSTQLEASSSSPTATATTGQHAATAREWQRVEQQSALFEQSVHHTAALVAQRFTHQTRSCAHKSEKWRQTGSQVVQKVHLASQRSTSVRLDCTGRTQTPVSWLSCFFF